MVARREIRNGKNLEETRRETRARLRGSVFRNDSTSGRRRIPTVASSSSCSSSFQPVLPPPDPFVDPPPAIPLLKTRAGARVATPDGRFLWIYIIYKLVSRDVK